MGKLHKSHVRHKIYPHLTECGILVKVYRDGHVRRRPSFILPSVVTGNKPYSIFFIRIFYKRIASSHFIAVYRNGVLSYNETHIVRLPQHFHCTPISAEEFLRRHVVAVVCIGTSVKQCRRNKNRAYTKKNRFFYKTPPVKIFAGCRSLPFLKMRHCRKYQFSKMPQPVRERAHDNTRCLPFDKIAVKRNMPFQCFVLPFILQRSDFTYHHSNQYPIFCRARSAHTGTGARKKNRTIS